MQISRRNALVGAGAAMAVAGVPGTVRGQDAELVALGRQWQQTYAEWMRVCARVEIAYDAGESSRRVRELEVASETPFECAWALKNRIAEIPAHSLDGALVKLRVVVAQDWITGEINDPFGRLTYQAWQSLETQHVAADFERLLGGMRP